MWLRDRGVMAAVHFDPPLHHMEIFPDADLPVTDTVSERIVTLPMFPDMMHEQMEYVVKTVKSVLRDMRGGRGELKRRSGTARFLA